MLKWEDNLEWNLCSVYQNKNEKKYEKNKEWKRIKKENKNHITSRRKDEILHKHIERIEALAIYVSSLMILQLYVLLQEL